MDKKSSQKPEKRDSDKNHGRYGASDYSGCETQHHGFNGVSSGDACPECTELNSPGKLYRYPAGNVIRLVGHPVVDGVKHTYDRLRCNLCLKVFSAELPSEVCAQPKYDASCHSALAINRFGMGMPFHRLEQYQRCHGVPVADSTMHDLMTALFDVCFPVYCALQRAGAEGDLNQYDDTSNRILEVMEQQNSKPRKGVHTTAMVIRCDKNTIVLFKTSQQIARENAMDLYVHRQSEAPFTSMTDASSHNMPSEVPEALLYKWIVSFCLVHGRRRFFEIREDDEAECDFVLEQLGQVYGYERHCKAAHLSDDERCAYHQEHSLPVMNGLKVWLTNQLHYHQVEVHSRLGKAIKYMLTHWRLLTRFIWLPGAVLDNNLAEQAIKVAIRHRRNSLFFRTENGAQVGDCLMSLIHTAMRNTINPFDYLNTLQRWGPEVSRAPDDWLPYRYQATLARLTQAQDTKWAA